jgi:tetratricopeptide (TPR) repeat protein
MAAIQTIRGRLDAAAELLEESIACHRACGDNRGLAYAISRKGYLAEASGDPAQAAQSYETTVELFRRLQDPVSLSYCLQSLSVVQAITGTRSYSAANLREALEISRAHGLKLHLIEGIERAVWLFIADDEPATGAELLGACEHLRATMGSLRELRDAELHDRTLASLRERLGQSASDNLFERGEAMPIELLVVRTMSLLASWGQPREG